jgi:copper chaperone CopZ
VGTLRLRVPDMTCRHCVRKVTAALRDVPGVSLVRADASTTTVELQGERLPELGLVLVALEAAGFPGATETPGRRAGR